MDFCRTLRRQCPILLTPNSNIARPRRQKYSITEPNGMTALSHERRCHVRLASKTCTRPALKPDIPDRQRCARRRHCGFKSVDYAHEAQFACRQIASPIGRTPDYLLGERPDVRLSKQDPLSPRNRVS